MQSTATPFILVYHVSIKIYNKSSLKNYVLLYEFKLNWKVSTCLVVYLYFVHIAQVALSVVMVLMVTVASGERPLDAPTPIFTSSALTYGSADPAPHSDRSLEYGSSQEDQVNPAIAP